VTDPIRSIKLRWWHGVLHDVTYQLVRSASSPVAPPPWQPAINAYRCEKSIRICVDLAGVNRSLIDLAVEPQRLSISGMRDVPQPIDAESRALQMIAMEIDYGPFEREVQLPAEIDVKKVRAEQRNGLLWIYLPLKKS